MWIDATILFSTNGYLATLDINNYKERCRERQTDRNGNGYEMKTRKHKHLNIKRYLLISGLRAGELFFSSLHKLV